MDASITIWSHRTHYIIITEYSGMVDDVIIYTGTTDITNEMAIIGLVYDRRSHFGGIRLEFLSIPVGGHHHARDRHGHDRCIGLYGKTTQFQV